MTKRKRHGFPVKKSEEHTPEERSGPEVNNASVVNGQKRSQMQLVAQQITSTYSSPLPPASEMQLYESTFPGSFNRILASAEKQMTHRHKLENRSVVSEIALAVLGQIFGFVLGAGGIAAACFTAYHGKEAVSIASIITSVGGLMWAFRRGSAAKREALDERRKAMHE